jgi:hypothetical protein
VPLVVELDLKGDPVVFEEAFDWGVVGLDAFLGVSALPHLGQELLGGVG